jgi:hypothetical protein
MSPYQILSSLVLSRALVPSRALVGLTVAQAQSLSLRVTPGHIHSTCGTIHLGRNPSAINSPLTCANYPDDVFLRFWT